MTQKRTLGRLQFPHPGNKDAFALGREREEKGGRGAKMERAGDAEPAVALGRFCFELLPK